MKDRSKIQQEVIKQLALLEEYRFHFTEILSELGVREQGDTEELDKVLSFLEAAIERIDEGVHILDLITMKEEFEKLNKWRFSRAVFIRDDRASKK